MGDELLSDARTRLAVFSRILLGLSVQDAAQ